VSGGQLGGRHFSDELVAEVAPDADTVSINTVSTVIAAYHAKHPELSLDTCTRAVKSFLGLPLGLELGLMVDNPYLPGFSQLALMLEAQKHGGLKAYSEKLVAEMDSGKQHHEFHAIHKLKGANGPMLGGIQEKVIEEFAVALAKGMGGKIGNDV